MEIIRNVEQKASIIHLGKVLLSVVENIKWPGYSCGIEEKEFIVFKQKIEKAEKVNPWFTNKMISLCLVNWALNLEQDNVEQWLKRYSKYKFSSTKNVFVICAGNLPLVGFHDILSCFISGHNIQIKLSSSDNVLIPAILDLLALFYPSLYKEVVIVNDKKPKNYDYVIATGSDNTNRYFEHYFGHVPNIFRKNRTSVAVLDNKTSDQDLELLADDVFSYFGLGCRSVTKLYLPTNYNTDKLFNAFYKYKNLINHNKYMNNFDYNRSIFLLQKEQFLENGFLILKEEENLFSPLSVINYEFYNDLNQLNLRLDNHLEKIQCRVGIGGMPFGTAQSPKLWDYADGIDTIDFLNK